jgi:hypothetical protein
MPSIIRCRFTIVPMPADAFTVIVVAQARHVGAERLAGEEIVMSGVVVQVVVRDVRVGRSGHGAEKAWRATPVG